MYDSDGIPLMPIPISREAYREQLRRKSLENAQRHYEKLLKLMRGGPVSALAASKPLKIGRASASELLYRGYQRGAFLRQKRKGSGKGGTRFVYSLKPTVSPDLAVAICLGEV
ncbi:hypothetical protein AYO47_03880 [Planctomyces sp. SCGC AG-212-M04]|nr:hypothetical protein AYO47_03880 [Planctomyces sp. SCGC AG-212-M04]